MKKSNYTIWNRTRDLPACSVVPHPTAPPRAPLRARACVCVRARACVCVRARVCMRARMFPVLFKQHVVKAHWGVLL